MPRSREPLCPPGTHYLEHKASIRVKYKISPIAVSTVAGASLGQRQAILVQAQDRALVVPTIGNPEALAFFQGPEENQEVLT